MINSSTQSSNGITQSLNGFMRCFFVIVLFFTLELHAQDTLTIERVRQLAEQASPAGQRKDPATRIAELQARNLRLNNLPRLAFNGQATWQSDVFALPIENPLFKVPVVPKDQYRLTADVSQRLWDGGTDRLAARRYALDRDLTLAQADAEAFQVRELVTDLFFRVLLVQENQAIVRSTRSDLERRLRQVEAQVTEGVALRTAADQVRVQLLRNEQQLAGLDADEQALKAVLAAWMGRSDMNFIVTASADQLTAATLPALSLDRRPELQVYAVQRRQLELTRDQLALRFQPRIEAFLQGGFGSPNPLNFFETGFEPFAMIGLRAQWTPLDWGRGRRDAQVLALQSKNIDVQHAALEQRLLAASIRDAADFDKYARQLAQDDRIIALQEDILRRAETQVQNGVMTNTDFLAQLSLLEQARLSRKTHELQARQARELWRARSF